MKHIRFSIITTAFFLGTFFLYLPFSPGQDISATAAENTAEYDTVVIKVSVNEVRLDVVVLDNRGRPVTDLKTSDFEISQNGRKQNLLSSVYVDNQPHSVAQTSASQKNNRNIPALPTAELKKEDTRRTIIFVLDEMSMSLENIYNAKVSLRNFVEKQMLPGDMVAILSTGRGNSALQMFLSDRNQLLARINALRLTSPPPDPNSDDSHFYRIYDNQLFTLSYGIRALKDMPGRKILNMLTAATTISVPPVRVLSDNYIDRVNFADIYNDRFSRLADDALRAGVVVNFLNVNGLQNTSKMQEISAGGWSKGDKDILGSDENNSIETRLDVTSNYDPSALIFNNPSAAGVNLSSVKLPKGVNVLIEEVEKDRYENALNARNSINSLPAKTGGITIEDNNFFSDGLGRDVDNLMKGYYLITYEPPAGTFSPDDKEIYNQIKVNVKRRNVQVHTRDGFYNRSEREKEVAAQPSHPLQDAIFSPFMYAGLDVNMAAGYVRDAKAGYLIHSWIHVDPKDAKITETDDGGARIDIETVCLTSDINGIVHDFVYEEHTLNIDPERKSENIAWIRKHGIRFAMLLPVKKPGSYYVRAAVRDAESGNIGSAYQFIEIPDIDRKGLALSTMFMLTNNEDVKWLLSDATKGVNERLFFPVFQAEEVRSPALRTYVPGDRFQTLTMLYNADEKAIAGSEIEMRNVLYKDGKEFLLSEPKPVGLANAGSLEGIPVSQTLTIDSTLPPGDYVLQLAITDKMNGKKQEGSASQYINFTVVEK